MTFSESEIDNLVLINLICSGLSFCGSLTIIVCFLYIVELRNFAFRLVFFVSLSDSLACLFRFFGNPQDNTLCQLQGFGSNLFDLASFMWVAAIAVVINMVRVKVDVFEPEKFLQKCHIVIWPSCLLFSILPFFSNSYGPAGGWCWIKDSDAIDDVWRIVCFYIQLLLIFCYLLYVYCGLYFYLKKDDDISEDSQAMLRKVVFFPLVVFVCYFFAFVRRMLEVCGLENTPYWLAVLHISFSSLLGLGNAIVYGAVNATVRRHIITICCEAPEQEEQSKDKVQMGETEVEDDANRMRGDTSVDIQIDE